MLERPLYHITVTNLITGRITELITTTDSNLVYELQDKYILKPWIQVSIQIGGVDHAFGRTASKEEH